MRGTRLLCLLAAAVSATALSAALPVAGSAATNSTSQAVIVVLRDQHPDLKPKIQAQLRQQTTNADQAGIVSSLHASGATNIKQFSTVSAVAAHANPAEIASLEANPAVAAVEPDRVIPLPAQQETAETANSAQAPGANPAASLCPANPNQPLLEPEALGLTNTASNNPSQPEAQQIATGKGVTVAYVADGIDINNPDFIRPDGTHVFTDYQDFSGDGTHDDSGGDEAFGDASSLAAQGNQVYDLSTALPNAGLPKGCTFRVRGVAPGASLVGIKVFGQYGAPESAFVEGIDYAVNHDKVDVLSESFGGWSFPDDADDPIALADEAATAAGVTVVASSGDSGQTGTVGSPASAPDIIAAGGTDSYRLNAMAKGYTGYVDDNITGLSSGGATTDNKYVDLVAPAMTGMAACTPNPTYWSACTATTEVFGGTSEACPFIAGASALVIQAYEDAHKNAKPSPALVKALLTGTATDLGAPADQQGAGLLNSYAAVRAAQAVGGSSANSTALIPSADQVNVTGPAGSTQHASVTLTNTANKPQTVTASSRQLGGQTFDFTKTDQVTGATAKTGGPGEDPVAAPQFTFTVPAGTPWVQAQLSWPGTATSGQLAFELFDPKGRLVQESYDYGFTNYQQVGVRNPTPGTWTEKILWDNGRDHFQEALPTPGSYRGPVHVEITGYRYAAAGTGTQVKTIPAGGSATFTVPVPLPKQAGDAPASLQFDSNLGTHVSVALARRVLIPTGSGSFTATITGGVGRGIEQYLSYYLDVPAGKQNMTIGLTSPDPQTQLDFYLINPEGQTLSGDTNAVETAWGSGKPTATNTATLTADQPAAGRWQLVMVLPGNSSGTEFSEPVTGTVRFNTVKAAATNLPSSVATTVSGTRTASITVTNTGTAGAYYFLDPRLDQQASVTLPPIFGDSAMGLPEDMASTSPPAWLVPTHTSSVAETVNASLPVGVYLYYANGNPGPYRTTGSGNAVTDTVSASQVAVGEWATDIGEIGPFSGTAATGTANVTMTAQTQPFDPGATASTGDYWQTSVGGSAGTAVFVPAGGSATLTLTLKPTAAAGSVVRGTVYVDTWNNLAGQGSELTGIPYTYTVG